MLQVPYLTKRWIFFIAIWKDLQKLTLDITFGKIFLREIKNAVILIIINHHSILTVEKFFSRILWIDRLGLHLCSLCLMGHKPKFSDYHWHWNWKKKNSHKNLYNLFQKTSRCLSVSWCLLQRKTKYCFWGLIMLIVVFVDKIVVMMLKFEF